MILNGSVRMAVAGFSPSTFPIHLPNIFSNPPTGDVLVAGVELVVVDLLPPNNPPMALSAEPAFSPPAPTHCS